MLMASDVAGVGEQIAGLQDQLGAARVVPSHALRVMRGGVFGVLLERADQPIRLDHDAFDLRVDRFVGVDLGGHVIRLGVAERPVGGRAGSLPT